MSTKLNYRLRFETDSVFRLTDNFIISPHMEKDWAEYQAWLKQGNTPLPAENFITPETASQPTIEEKLASVGLDLNDLKKALGIN
jgi:hypothetical protein